MVAQPCKFPEQENFMLCKLLCKYTLYVKKNLGHHKILAETYHKNQHKIAN